MKKIDYNKSVDDWVFTFISYALIIFICILTLYPVIYVVSASFSSAASVTRGDVAFLPKELTTRAYVVVGKYKGLWTAYANTIFYTVVGSALSVILTSFAAYPLSRKKWKARKVFSLMIVFTMWFSGGMISFFLVIKGLGLMDTRTSILLYPAIAAFYVIILRTYFEGIPEEINESAMLDGANEMIILFKIILPLSLPAIATIALYYAVGRWNSFFWEMILLSDENKVPVQVLLQRIILSSQLGQDMQQALTRGEASIPKTIQYACIVVTALPIIMIYPFAQKYFVKGVLVGGVKG